MKIAIDKSRCIDCGTCVAACNYNALYMDSDFILCYDPGKCRECLICFKACPLRIIKVIRKDV